MKFILGKKIGMTQVFKGDSVMPVTLIESGPNFVTQIKTKEKDGYIAVQVRFGRWLKEFRVENSELSAQGGPASGWKVGDEIKLDIFIPGDKVNVIAISKGKGFQGVVKRHGFHGGPKSHGQKDRLRAPGSIGASWPQHVIKGMRMAGRMGGEKTTVKNLEIAEIDKENNLMAVKGAVPGRKGTLVMIKG